MTAISSIRTETTPSKSAFSPTPTASAITDILLACHHYRLLGTVIGNPGTGKSTAAEAYAASARGVAHVPMVKAAYRTQAALMHLVRSIGTGRRAPRTTGEYELHCMIEEALAAETVELLIVDEAQHVSDDMLGCLRDLYDRCGIGLVWVGNFTLADRWTGKRGARNRAFDAILGRRGPQIELDELLDGDVDAIASHHGIDDAASRDVLSSAAATRGGLHNVSRILRVAKGRDGSHALSPDRLRDAAVITGVAA